MSEKKEKASEKPQFDILPSFDDAKKDTAPSDKGAVRTVKKAASSKDENRTPIKGSLSKKTNNTSLTSKTDKSASKEADDQKTAKKQKKSEKLVKDGLSISDHNEHAKLIFILCMILFTPLALVVALAVIALFLIVLAFTLLVGGVMGIALIGIVAAGVVLAFVGAAYGLISMLTAEGFALVAGQYELGLSLAIAGVTIILSALLYSGITDLVPFIIKKLGQFFKFLAIKVKKLISWLYKYSTRL